MLSVHGESGKHVATAIFELNQMFTLYRGYMESAKRLDGRLLVPGTELGHDGKTGQDLIMAVHEPLGTVAAIVPFNAPLLLYSFKVAPALAAGNAVIVKAADRQPACVHQGNRTAAGSGSSRQRAADSLRAAVPG